MELWNGRKIRAFLREFLTRSLLGKFGALTCPERSRGARGRLLCWPLNLDSDALLIRLPQPCLIPPILVRIDHPTSNDPLSRCRSKPSPKPTIHTLRSVSEISLCLQLAIYCRLPGD